MEEKVLKICEALLEQQQKEIKTIILVNLFRIFKCRVGFLSIYDSLCTAVASWSYLYFPCVPVFNLYPTFAGKTLPLGNTFSPFCFHFETGAELPS